MITFNAAAAAATNQFLLSTVGLAQPVSPVTASIPPPTGAGSGCSPSMTSSAPGARRASIRASPAETRRSCRCAPPAHPCPDPRWYGDSAAADDGPAVPAPGEVRPARPGRRQPRRPDDRAPRPATLESDGADWFARTPDGERWQYPQTGPHTGRGDRLGARVRCLRAAARAGAARNVALGQHGEQH